MYVTWVTGPLCWWSVAASLGARGSHIYIDTIIYI